MKHRTHLAVRGLTKRYAQNLVLEQAECTVGPGEKVGMVGDNGSGKSTLLRLLAGDEAADNGSVRVEAPASLGHLPQHVDLDLGATVADAVDTAFADLRDLQRRMAECAADGDLSDPANAREYAELTDEFDARDGWNAPVRLEKSLAALGVSGIPADRPWETLSGGERRRVILAAILSARPGLLLLDEPSNDLDADAVAWLERELRDYRGTIVAVTHDRAFLDSYTTTILEVAERKVRRYGDGFSGYLRAKETERRQAREAYEAWKSEWDRQAGIVANNVSAMAVIPRKMEKAGMGTGAHRMRSRSHGAQSRVRMANARLEALAADRRRPPPDPLAFRPSWEAGEDVPEGPAITLVGASVPGRLAPMDLAVEHGGRLLIEGPNGAGKSTLLSVIAGELEARGTVRRFGRVGHLRQNPVAGRRDATLLQAFAHGRVGTDEDHSEALLDLGLFDEETLGSPAANLSVGQRRRLELARVVTAPADILLLDEPTNHLAPWLVHQLQEALEGFTGTVVAVSHDRLFRSSFGGERLELA
ncbi:ABC-F family ATP-binding cassette domain-containing protein [Salininema proteolyticum]|uniref:ABC-F family ATP-binding cassette domain-containing protein n=1 Tax=Salininema proteolyticum TaxID=1607685 RepID=A0ABV8TZQ3_9ACTN